MNRNKQEIRLESLSRRHAVSDDVRLHAGEAIRQNVRSLPFYQESDCIALYAADRTEADLLPLLELDRATKRFFLPRYCAAAKNYEMVQVENLATELVIGKYGISEPIPTLPAATAAELDLMLFLVPGVAFDLKGNRLGRGKGYYDRLLQNRSGKAVGIFFACQEQPEIPAEAHDVRLDLIVTEAGVITPGSPRKNCGSNAAN